MIYDYRSGSGYSGDSYREGFVPTKVENGGLFFGAAPFLMQNGVYYSSHGSPFFPKCP